MRLNTAATVLRVAVVEDLKNSVMRAAGPEEAALAAARAWERQPARALTVVVRRVPVQSAWTTARLAMDSWKSRRTLAASAPSTAR
jgi:hypothetical protein